MYKITIICPTYNCENYIERTIQSIINQSIGFENIELILVDDCSNDKTRFILKKYENKYENISLYVSSENHGFPGFGRNYGISKATSDYIMFIDNDDEYDSEFCSIMYNYMESEDNDIICTNYNIIKKNKIIKKSTYAQINNYDKQEDNKKYIDLTKFFYLYGTEVWSKIFKKSIIINNNIKFIENGFNEDTLFLYEYYHYSKKLLYIDYYGYNWYRDGDNLSYYSAKSTLGFIESYYELYNLINKFYSDINWNKLFKGGIEWSIIRISFSYTNLKELNNMLNQLYEFELFIEFNNNLSYFWTNIINKLLLKKYFKIVKLGLILVRKLRNILQRINRL